MKKFFTKTALWIIALPFLSFVLGAAANQLVLAVNQDRFPVLMNEAKVQEYALKLMHKAEKGDEEAQFRLAALDYGYLDDVHVIMTKHTHLNFLADWIDLDEATYSPGDVLIELGEQGLEYAPIVWFAVVITKLNRREET